MAKSARARSTCAAGALSERLRRVSSWRSSAVSGRRGSFWWHDMGHLGARGSPHHHTSSHGRRPTRLVKPHPGTNGWGFGGFGGSGGLGGHFIPKRGNSQLLLCSREQNKNMRKFYIQTASGLRAAVPAGLDRQRGFPSDHPSSERVRFGVTC